VTRLTGPRGKHDSERCAYRHGQETRQVTLGGRRVQVDKPPVRSLEDEELELRTFRAFARRDLLNAAALERMLAGLSTRRYPAGLEPIGDVEPLATSKSAVSRAASSRALSRNWSYCSDATSARSICSPFSSTGS